MTDTPDGFRQMDKAESESQALEQRRDDADAVLAREVESESRSLEQRGEDTGIDVVESEGDFSTEELEAFWDHYDSIDPRESDALRGAWGVQAGDNLALVYEFIQSPEGAALLESLPEGAQADPAWLVPGLRLARQWKAAQDMPVAPMQRNGAMAQGSRQEQLQDALAQLTKEQDTAMSVGDHAKATALDAQIMKISAAISGDGPIVGGLDRTI